MGNSCCYPASPSTLATTSTPVSPTITAYRNSPPLAHSSPNGARTGGGGGGDGTFGAGDGEFNAPRGIDADSSDNIWVADSANGRLQKFDSIGTVLTKLTSLTDPRGVAVSSTGLIYVSDATDDNIAAYSSVPGAPQNLAVPSVTATTIDVSWDAPTSSGASAIIDYRVDVNGGLTTIVGTSGTITGLTASTAFAVKVQARNAQGFGPSSTTVNPNTAALTADLAVTKSGSPDPVLLGQNITYTVTVTNNGPGSATTVTATDTLPAGVTFVSAVASQGSCVESVGVVTCNLGDIANGANVTVTIVVTAAQTGSKTNNVSVSAVSPTDPVPANDTASEITTVQIPPAVPGITTWGLLVLALGLTAGVLYMRRRTTAPAR